MPLLWRVLGVNAAVLVAGVLVLVVSPATVSARTRAVEVAVLLGGLAVIVVLDYLLLRHAFAPLERLAGFARRVDPLHPGERVEDGEPAERQVADATRAINDMIERLETERRDSAREALSAQEAERIRIARELHDEVGQTLTAVLLQLERAVRETQPGDGVRAPVEEARELARAAAEEVREIARRLRPEALDDLGLPSALVSLATASARHRGVRVAHHIDADLPPLDDEAELVIYRVAQEALTNVARHAATGAAELRLQAAPAATLPTATPLGATPLAGAPPAAGRPAAVMLTVRDEGAGFDPVAVRGDERGIRGMRERAMLVRARLELDSRPGAGTCVRLTVPAAEAAEAAEASEAGA